MSDGMVLTIGIAAGVAVFLVVFLVGMKVLGRFSPDGDE